MKKTTIILLLIIAVGVLSVILFQKPGYILDPNIQWETDTVYINKPYPVPEPYGILVPPRIIKIYGIDSSAIDSLKLIMSNDSILIIGLKNQIAIHQNYLKQFPNNPKLIDLNLVYDTLALSLLDTDGIISNKSYPIFLDLYKYRWFNEKLTREDNIRKIPLQKTYLEYRAGVGYDILWLSPYLSGEIIKEYTRFNLYGRIDIGLLNKNTTEIKVGINYNFDEYTQN